MQWNLKFFLIGLWAVTVAVTGSPVPKQGKSLEMKQPVDPNKKYWLGWSVDEANEEITFEVEVQTKGYVGFGISPSGSMISADIFIAGVDNDGVEYYGDYHGSNKNGAPIKDSHDDWKLLAASENQTHTKLRFSRKLITCDDEDYPIRTDTNRLIWSIGNTDDIAYHAERGTYSTNLLLPDNPFDGSEYLKFDTMANTTMPAQDTTYWCTIHNGPQIQQKHHIVAFEANLPSVEAEEYTHHFVMYKCTTPEGMDPEEVFGKLVHTPGNHCYASPEEQTIPTQYCQEAVFVWAKGGKRMVFPEGVGYPVGENLDVKQYYMLEVHYDNPKSLAGLQFDTGVRSYLTPKLREIEASLAILGHHTVPSLTVPPETTNFVTVGHCPSACTDAFLPEEGVTVFNSLLHGHLSGRKLKLRHFRNGQEIEWMDYDDHYDFNYQQNKPILEVRKILPGDHLTYECVYDSTWKGNGEAVSGGLTSRDEMCEAFIWYYPKARFDICASHYPLDQGFKDFGITKYHDFDGGNGLIGKVVIDEPAELAGDYLQSISFKFNWTEEFKKEFQEKRRFGNHEFSCGSLDGEFRINGESKYAEFENDYAPIDECAKNKK